jgi:hypothetical protein
MSTMRPLAILIVVAACGGSSKPPPPAPVSDTMPIAGLEAVKRGASAADVAAVFPTAEAGGEDDLWVEVATIEERQASLGLLFEDGALRSATVAFTDPCDQLDVVAKPLDVRLGKRTSAEPGVAAWSHAGWDVALYCASGDTGDWLRMDVRPAASF